MDDDRKATLEAAFDAAEQGQTVNEAVEQITTAEPIETVEPAAETTAEKVAEKEPQSAVAASETTAVETTKPEAEAATDDQNKGKPLNLDRAPQAWKPAQKAKWASLDPEIRQEVLRREHETTRVLNETAQVRQFTTQFQQAVQPYMARISQVGDPVKAIANLLAADNLLATGPKVAKAHYLAKLIKEYEVDIHELDAALAGSAPADPVESRVEKLLQERLTPFQQYISQQQQREQQQAQQTQQQLAQTIQQMTEDPAFPHFEEVREAMADLIELRARKGQTIDLPTAYNMAVAMDPVLSKQVAETNSVATQVKQAAQANSRAQRALRASSSVSGTPGSSTSGAPKSTDRRAQLEAAFASWEGR
jgi:hypothetical protein